MYKAILKCYIDWYNVKPPLEIMSELRRNNISFPVNMLSWVSLDELMFLEFAHTPWCPTPFKAWDHRWHQDWEWASTDSMCTQELLTYCVVHQPKNLWFTCKPIDYCSHRLPRFSVNCACLFCCQWQWLSELNCLLFMSIFVWDVIYI